MRLRLHPDGSLEVAAPPGTGSAQISRFVAASADWIERARQALHTHARAHRPEIDGPRPSVLELTALAQRVGVDYRVVGDRPGFCWHPDRLEIRLEQPDSDCVPVLLRAALRRQAQMHLEPRLKTLAAVHGFAPGRIGWRNQRSRWGSCSKSGDLSLNIKLLFVAPKLADYVLAHELAHLRHLNHSPAFWQTVATIEPGWRALRRALRGAWRALPGWLIESPASRGVSGIRL